MSKVLIYNLDPEKDAKVKMLCRKMNIEAQTVEKSDYSMTMGALLGLTEDTARREGKDFDDEMMYLVDLRGGMLNLFASPPLSCTESCAPSARRSLNSIEQYNISLPSKY